MISRRRFIETTAALAATPLSLPLFSQRAAAQEKAFDVKDMLKPGPLPDMALGNPDAKVVVIEYLSMTCSHCAHFATTTFPEFKTKYIDSGKVYYLHREYPLDPLAAAGFMLARNAPGGRYWEMTDYLFAHLTEWAYVNDPVSALRAIAKQFGYTPTTFNTTLSDQTLLDGINAAHDRGNDAYGVNATPTFFINGVKYPGAMSIEEISALIDPQL